MHGQPHPYTQAPPEAFPASGPAAAGFRPEFGALLLGDGTARFRLWAPDLEEVALEINGRDPVSMQSCGRGFFEARAACAQGDRYRYRIGPDCRVPDPASRLQDGDVHDASIVLAPDAYPWIHSEWRGRPWTETVLYEIHAGLAGGFAGIEKQLKRLARLGITALELMPIADFPGPRNWGYDGVLPYAPDRAYGTPDELKHLIDAAHGEGLMVFLDVVYNHFGPDGNYLPLYASGFFRADRQTPWGGVIDFRKAQVRRFFAENALYWLSEYRFDGLRLDAVHAIGERDWLPEMAQFVRRRLPHRRHIHLVLENDDNEASLMTKGFDAQWNDDGHHVLHRALTGETDGYYAAYSGEPATLLARFLSEGFVYQGQPCIVRHGAPLGEPSAALPPTAFVLFLQNHDQVGNRARGERLGALAGAEPEALRAAVALQLLCPQIPLLFMGEEYGSTAPFLYFTSYSDPALAQAVRDGRRREFGHDHTAGADAIPDPNDPATYEASDPARGANAAAAASWSAYYRSLLNLRRTRIVPRLAGARSAGAQRLAPRAVAAQWRLGDESLLTLYLSLEKSAVAVAPGPASAPGTKAAHPLFESRPGAFDSVNAGRLPPACLVAIIEEGPRGGGANPADSSGRAP